MCMFKSEAPRYARRTQRLRKLRGDWWLYGYKVLKRYRVLTECLTQADVDADAQSPRFELRSPWHGYPGALWVPDKNCDAEPYGFSWFEHEASASAACERSDGGCWMPFYVVVPVWSKPRDLIACGVWSDTATSLIYRSRALYIEPSDYAAACEVPA